MTALQRVANCNRRDAITLALKQAARLPGRSRAVPASHQSWADDGALSAVARANETKLAPLSPIRPRVHFGVTL